MHIVVAGLADLRCCRATGNTHTFGRKQYGGRVRKRGSKRLYNKPNLT